MQKDHLAARSVHGWPEQLLSFQYQFRRRPTRASLRLSNLGDNLTQLGNRLTGTGEIGQGITLLDGRGIVLHGTAPIWEMRWIIPLIADFLWPSRVVPKGLIVSHDWARQRLPGCRNLPGATIRSDDCFEGTGRLVRQVGPAVIAWPSWSCIYFYGHPRDCRMV